MFSPLLLLIILYLSILSWRFVGLSHCLGRFHRGWVTCLSFLLFVILLLRCTWDLAKSISLFVTNETTFVISTAPSTFTTEQINASAATSGSVIWIFLHLMYIYIYIHILHSLSWSFGIPCEIFLFSTAPSTSLLTFETEETSAPCASAATSGSVIRIFLHLTCTYIYIYIHITFAFLVFWHSMWNLPRWLKDFIFSKETFFTFKTDLVPDSSLAKSGRLQVFLCQDSQTREEEMREAETQYIRTRSETVIC